MLFLLFFFSKDEIRLIGYFILNTTLGGALKVVFERSSLGNSLGASGVVGSVDLVHSSVMRRLLFYFRNPARVMPWLRNIAENEHII